MNVLRTSVVRLGVAAVVGCAAGTVALAQTYQVSELPTPVRGNSVARGLNNNGSAAGRSGTTFETQTVAFVSRGSSTFEIIGTLARGEYSSAYGINDIDQVVG